MAKLLQSRESILNQATINFQDLWKKDPDRGGSLEIRDSRYTERISEYFELKPYVPPPMLLQSC